MPQYASWEDTEEIRWRKLIQNLYEDAGATFPDQPALPSMRYVALILAVWGVGGLGPDGYLTKRFAVALNDRYGLGVTFSPFDTDIIYLRKVAVAATGECSCPPQEMFDVLALLIDWSAGLVSV